MHFFPRIFYLLFAIFHFYNLSFPFGFSYTALVTTMCFMLHSMLFFWHRYELPAAAMGRYNADHARLGAPSPERNILPPMPMDSAATRNTQIRGPDVQPHMPVRTFGTRSHSFNQSASGLMSRNSSTTGLFQGGGEEDDDDESYMYHLAGEVVMHRNQHQRVRTPSPFATIVRTSSRQRFGNEIDTYLPSNIANSTEGRVESRRPSFSAGRSFSSNGSSHRRASLIDELDYTRTSSLQAVLTNLEHDRDEGSSATYNNRIERESPSTNL
jgi:hypothetical protein